MSERKYELVGYDKKGSLVWTCVEERGWSRLDNGIGYGGLGSKEEREAKEEAGR